MVTTKKQALGRGLSALLPDKPHFEDIAPGEAIVQISVEQLHPDKNQPRQTFDQEKLLELAESIRNFGIMQPLLVVSTGKSSYKIVAGERRYRAAQLAELKELPCIVRKYSKSELAEISLIENIQREDLNAIEEAEAYLSLLESFHYTQEQLSERLGKSRSHIANTLRLLQLPPQYRALLSEGKITAGHARAILSLADVKLQAKLVDMILKNSLSVRQAESLAKQLIQHKPQKKAALPRKHTAHINDLEKKFTTRLGLPVQIVGDLKKGKLVIPYHSADDLENLIDYILSGEN